ncbi:MAG: hypothetical protein JNL72_09035 [Flavipsychrobacter sp.]|nr:hypothetical protein [Flavipsychrobacter sp.]
MASNTFIKFTIRYRLTGDAKAENLEFVLNNQAVSTGTATVLILEALLPQDITTATRLFVSLILDGAEMLPEIPATGFANYDELYSWLQANWYIYGKWFITGNKLVLYLNAGMATQGTLAVTTTSKYVYTAAIPEKQQEAYYYVSFMKDGIEVLPAFPEDMAATVEDILVWANQYWPEYGTWQVENNLLVLSTGTPAATQLSVTGILPGGFDFGFSKGFDT